MMKIDTLLFGQLEIQKEEVIYFPSGIPGYESMKKFVLIRPDEEIPFSYMQSVDESALSFLVTDPFQFYQDYEFDLGESDREELQVSEGDVMVRSMVSIKDDLRTATLNLLAPIVFNTSKQVGKQIVLHDTKYTTRHRLMQEAAAEELMRRGG